MGLLLRLKSSADSPRTGNVYHRQTATAEVSGIIHCWDLQLECHTAGLSAAYETVPLHSSDDSHFDV